MRSAPVPPSSYTQRAPLRRRAFAIALTVLVNGAIVVMLLRLAAFPDRKPESRTQLISIALQPEVPAPHRAPTRIRKPSGGGAPRPPVPVAEPLPPLPMIVVSREVYAASDISRFPTRRREQTADAAAPGAGSGPAAGPGDGPGGERLYDADWYRKPTHAELVTYLPPGVGTGWGMIACQTIAQYRVDNCHELADSPPGSGLARAVRQAAWQFRIRPPRIGGRVLVGAWVRIRIEVTPEGAGAPGDR